MRPSLSKTSIARAAAAGVLLVLVAATVGACTPKAGSAAVVGDRRITVDEVQASTREVLATAEALGAQQPSATEVNRSQVGRLVTDELLRETADRLDVTVTQAEVDALVEESLGGRTREQFAQELAATQLVPVSQFESFAEVVLLNQKLVELFAAEIGPEQANAALLAALGSVSEDLGTSVNPRFGEWNAEAIDLGLPPDDLSVPAPDEAPAPEVVGGSVTED